MGHAGRGEDPTRGGLSVQGSASSRGSLLAPRSAKQVSFKEVVKVYGHTLPQCSSMQCFPALHGMQRTCMSLLSLHWPEQRPQG